MSGLLEAVCVLWLVLWRRRTGRGWLAWPLVLCGAAVALAVAAMAG
ncbi:hypothetical protein [Streptomyces sp. NPDC051665]